MPRLKKILKIIGIVLGILMIGIFIAAHVLLKPRSDEKVLEKLDNLHHKPHIYYNLYKEHTYRVVGMQKKIDTTLPTLVFVHGSPGSVLDFSRYFKDSLINTKANILGYDRIGYGVNNAGEVNGTIAFELEILHDVTKNIPSEKIILIGYSYGGPVILASPKQYKYKVSLASSISADLEPMFWSLNLYKWELTRPLLPKVLRAASEEKYAHLSNLPNYEEKWNVSPSPIVNIHGDEDWIVPYKNSINLEKKIDKNKFTMVTIGGGGHELIWSDFTLIKNEILKILK
ncbi:MAG: alpha/beta fold hydrolase [Aureibaculum sp.]|nr:alpha/beta fold hydrolase [Aureibaculum sp.]